MVYVDGYVLVVSKKRLDDYTKLAKLAGKVWMEHGALSYVEAIGEDLNVKKYHLVSFPKIAKAKRGEIVIFSYITFKNRAHRDSVNTKVMHDARMKEDVVSNPPFDMKRMLYGGFESIVEL